MSDPAIVDDDRDLLNTPSRQSPLAVVFLAWRVVRGVSIVNIVVLFALVSSGRLPLRLVALAPVAAVVLGAIGLVSWWRYTFVVEGDELVVAKGLISQNRLVIPLDRVQSVSLEQGVLHRITGLTRVGLDTAGSSEVEFSIDAISLTQAEALQRLAADYRPRREVVPGTATDAAVGGVQPVGGAVGGGVDGAVDSSPGNAVDGLDDHVEEEVLVRRDFGQLVRIALGHWPWAGLVLLAPLFAAFGDLADAVGFDLLNRVERQVTGDAGDSVTSTPIVLLAVGVLGLILIGAALSWALQLVRQVVTDWDLTVTLKGRALRRVAGLTNRTSVGSSLDRVQVLRTSAIPMQRWFGILRLSLVTVGDSNLVVPGTTPEELARFRQLVFEGPEPEMTRRFSKATVTLAVRNAAIVALTIVAFLLWSPVGPWALMAFAIIPAEFAMARWRLARQRWGFTENRLSQCSRFITHRSEEMDPLKAQSVTVRQRFFQRRRGLASVHVKAAEGSFELAMVSLPEACALRDLILYRVESTGRSWM